MANGALGEPGLLIIILIFPSDSLMKAIFFLLIELNPFAKYQIIHILTSFNCVVNALVSKWMSKLQIQEQHVLFWCRLVES